MTWCSRRGGGGNAGSAAASLAAGTALGFLLCTCAHHMLTNLRAKCLCTLVSKKQASPEPVDLSLSAWDYPPLRPCRTKRSCNPVPTIPRPKSAVYREHLT